LAATINMKLRDQKRAGARVITEVGMQIEMGEFQGDPRNPASGVWDKADQFVLNRILRYFDGKLAKIRLIVVDSGCHCTTEVYRYCSSRRPRVFALKGYGGQGKPIIIGGRTTEKSQSAWLLRIGVDTLKDDFHSRLAMDKPGPGFLHWPRGGDGEEVRGYTEASLPSFSPNNASCDSPAEDSRDMNGGRNVGLRTRRSTSPATTAPRSSI
jgi:phage terminase large subunit GpA-like protein